MIGNLTEKESIYEENSKFSDESYDNIISHWDKTNAGVWIKHFCYNKATC